MRVIMDILKLSLFALLLIFALVEAQDNQSGIQL